MLLCAGRNSRTNLVRKADWRIHRVEIEPLNLGNLILVNWGPVICKPHLVAPEEVASKVVVAALTSQDLQRSRLGKWFLRRPLGHSQGIGCLNIVEKRAIANGLPCLMHLDEVLSAEIALRIVLARSDLDIGKGAESLAFLLS